jgi:uncharacterized LabA/DUF88 family protein
MSAIKHISQRVAVFIDTQNLYHTAKHVYNNSRVHFGKVVEEAVAGRSLVRALAYVITTEARDEQNFFEALEKLGIEIKTKDLQIFIDGSKKADWDVAIAIDAVRIAPKVDVVILATGDGDFVPLAQYLRQLGVQVEVVCFDKSISAKLKEEADIFMDLSKDLDYFLINSSGKINAIKNQSLKRSTNTKSRAKVNTINKIENNFTPSTTGVNNLKITNKNIAIDTGLIPLSDKNYTVARKMK